ncbi:MAG: proton-conducting transporter membrane subunit [Opitutaceae bacterium]|nr:proton-conducting transporter membrane subunit [Opitutaceae bacterium]
MLKNDTGRRVLVISSVVAIGLLSIKLLVDYYAATVVYFHLPAKWIESLVFPAEVAIGLLILGMCFRYRRWFPALLVLAQSGLIAWLEYFSTKKVISENPFFLDKFSLIMALIIGVVGGLIAVYALGYMKVFQEDYHKEVADRRGMFFLVLFLFIGAMFGIVFANDLIWMYFFWEITTLASFLLIGYKGNKESIDNSFKALLYNLIGGLGFAGAIVYLNVRADCADLSQVLDKNPVTISLALGLLAVAGLTKSAQLPFSRWLLGAMVAPSPVSALLHSSTMVKAGVYLLIKLAPLFKDTTVGYVVALVGGITFLVSSFAAISQSDAKKVLAHSTIANLGLIVLCAGIGTSEAVWAAILLVVFHAVAKCLLFLCVGSVEHALHSRSIESMDGLILAMPKTAWMMLIGMAGMFLAPFGMLISKWAVLKAVVDANPLLTVLLIYGSAANLFFWVKWMGKLIMLERPSEELTALKLEANISRTISVPLFSLGFLTVAACLTFPIMSAVLIEPYVLNVFGATVSMTRGNLIIMVLMLGMLLLFPFNLEPKRKGRWMPRVVDAYLAGVNYDSYSHVNSLGGISKNASRNYYLEKYFSESVLLNAGIISTVTLLVVMFLMGSKI